MRAGRSCKCPPVPGSDMPTRIDGPSPLGKMWWKVMAGSYTIMLFLSEKGADLGVQYREFITPLTLSAYGGHLEVVRYLVEQGYDDKNRGLSDDNKYGDWALVQAARGGHLEVVRFLVDEGFEPIGHGPTAPPVRPHSPPDLPAPRAPPRTAHPSGTAGRRRRRAIMPPFPLRSGARNERQTRP